MVPVLKGGGTEHFLLMLSSSSPKIEYFTVAGAQLSCYASLHTLRTLVPVSLRQAVISAIHTIAHRGIKETKRLITSCFVRR
jgi:hypothetical protein